MSARPTVGFVGLGSQGGPMAARIAGAGFALTLWARRVEALAPFPSAAAAASLTDLASACDHIGLCVVDDAGVAQVCDALIPAMRPGSLLAIHSTIMPESCVALAARCHAAGLLFLDAPVSGGGPAAAAGTLTVMCGGTAQAFAAAQPVLASFGGAIVHLGGAGAGQRAKLVNNALLAANMGLAHAAMGAGAALGVDRKALAEIIKVSSGRSMGFEVYARLPNPQAFAHGAPLLVKDVALLEAVLPEDAGARLLRHAARGFLAAASGTPQE